MMIGAPIVALLEEIADPGDRNEIREDNLQKFSEIKSALHVMKAAEIRRQLERKPEKLNIVLNYLISTAISKQETSVCADILSTCVEALDGDTLCVAFKSHLSVGLLSSNDEIVLLCIKTTGHILDRGKNQVESLFCDRATVSALVGCMKSRLEIANKCGKVLKNLLTANELMTKLNLWSFVEKELEQCVVDDVVKIRIQELLVDCSVLNESSFNAIATWNLFEELITDSVCDDILVQLNTFMILSNLAACEHGFEYLQSKQVLKLFSQLLTTVDSHPFANLLLPGLLKFFGGVCQHKPDQVLSQHPEFISKLFTQMTMGDSLALETTAFIARGARGKKLLHSNKERFEAICLHLTGSLCHSSDTNQRVNGFLVAADLFHLEREEARENNELSSILKDWWMNLGLTWVYLLEQVHRPFEDVQVAIHQLLANVLPYHHWVLHSFNNAAGFMEYILGRQTDVGRGVLLSKYELVCRLADSVKAREVLGDRVYVKLQSYRSNGPYYAIPTDPQVAIERE